MTAEPVRGRAWVISGLLLLATMINYMDRQTLSNVAVRVTTAFGLTSEQYGNLEFGFGWAFAAGSLVFGFLVDRINVRILYPIALTGWSIAGFATGFATSYEELLVCRLLLGLFEAGHWPCALATIQRLLPRDRRTLGNSVLQSGASFGAILTPLIVIGLLRSYDPGESVRMGHFALGGPLAVGATGVPPSVWQYPFLIIGAVGMIWVVLWLGVVRSGDLVRPPEDTTGATPASISGVFLDRRFYVLLVMVTAINTTWQIVRAWLPKFLIEGRGYPEAEALFFNSAYYIATDVGCLTAGAVTLALARRGMSVHRSRLSVYGVCAVITSLTLVAVALPRGTALLGVLLVIAAGSLGLFPCYYSFSQELTARHMGKVTGFLAAFGWFVSSPVQKLFGWLVDTTGSFDLGFGLVGLPPLVALVVMLILWRSQENSDGK